MQNLQPIKQINLDECAKKSLWAGAKLVYLDYGQDENGTLTKSQREMKTQAMADLIVNGLPIAAVFAEAFFKWLLTPSSPVVAIGPVQPIRPIPLRRNRY